MRDIQAIVFLIVVIPICMGLAYIFGKGLDCFYDKLDDYHNEDEDEDYDH